MTTGLLALRLLSRCVGESRQGWLRTVSAGRSNISISCPQKRVRTDTITWHSCCASVLKPRDGTFSYLFLVTPFLLCWRRQQYDNNQRPQRVSAPDSNPDVPTAITVSLFSSRNGKDLKCLFQRKKKTQPFPAQWEKGAVCRLFPPKGNRKKWPNLLFINQCHFLSTGSAERELSLCNMARSNRKTTISGWCTTRVMTENENMKCVFLTCDQVPVYTGISKATCLHS